MISASETVAHSTATRACARSFSASVAALISPVTKVPVAVAVCMDCNALSIARVSLAPLSITLRICEREEESVNICAGKF